MTKLLHLIKLPYNIQPLQNLFYPLKNNHLNPFLLQSLLHYFYLKKVTFSFFSISRTLMIPILYMGRFPMGSGYPLQFLAPPTVGLWDFHYYP